MLQPTNEPNFDGLVDSWYQAAETREVGTNAKKALFEETEQVAAALEGLVSKGNEDDIEKAGKFARIILNSFEYYKPDETNKLHEWIGAEDANQCFQHLVQALDAVENAENEMLGKFADNWYEAAQTGEVRTDAKKKLYAKTEKIVATLERLVSEGDIKQAGKFADIILNSFDRHKPVETYGLIEWIGAHTLKSGNKAEGAYKCFHHLFETLKAVDKAEKETLAIENKSLESGRTGTAAETAHRSLNHLFESIFGQTEDLSNRDQIGTLSDLDEEATDYLERHDASIHGWKDEEIEGLAERWGIENEKPIFPPDVLKQILSDSVLKQTSTVGRQQFAKNYRGRLTKLNIKTADEAIEYVKKYGKEMTYLDISNIDFSQNSLSKSIYGNKFEELLKHLPNLDTLKAWGCNLHSRGVEILVASKNSRKLKYLDLGSNAIGNKGVKDLASSANLINVKILKLDNNNIGSEGAKDLAASETLNLKELDLQENAIENRGIKALSASKSSMKNIVTLNLRGNRIGDHGVEDLANSPVWQNVQELDLRNNSIRRAIITIANSKYLLHLEKLKLSFNAISDRKTFLFASSPILQKLKHLELAGNEIGDMGATAIAVAQTPNLETLVLGYNEIGLAGATALANSATKSNLKVLHIKKNLIDDIGKEALKSSVTLKNTRIIM